MRRNAKASSAGPASSLRGLGGPSSIASVCALVTVALLATSGTAEAAGCPNEAIREQQPSTSLPDCRAYEMVSPLDKGSRDVTRNLVTNNVSSRAAAEGSAVAYTSLGAFGDPRNVGLWNQYRSERTGGGWLTRGVNAPYDPGTGNAQNPITEYLSEDLSSSVVKTDSVLLPGNGLLGGSWPLYLQRFSATGSTFDLLSAPWQQLPLDSDGEGGRSSRFEFGGSNGDMSAIVFTSERRLTEDGPLDLAGASRPNALYLWRDGEVEFLSVLPDGTPAAEPSAGSSIALQGGNFNGFHVVSDDGEVVFFQGRTPSSVRPVFAREHGAVTRVVSASERTGELGEMENGNFIGASADGSAAVLRGNGLTDDTVGEEEALYHWDGTAPLGSRLESLTVGAADPFIDPLVMMSDDASTVYFVTQKDPLDAGGTPGSRNLYVWKEGTGVRFIATLAPSDTSWSISRTDAVRPVRVTPDGERLAFVSKAQLTSYDNAGHSEVYLYDASEDQVRCVSCSAISAAADADADLMKLVDEPGEHFQAPLNLPRNLSIDGTRVFFETAGRLVPGDTNGLTDVYLWEGGQINLVSTGRSGDVSQFIDASESGDDVFLATREQLVAADTDQHVDVYDARVGGGFLEAPAVTGCQGDTCQGPPASAPAGSPPATTTFAGSGNVKPKAKRRCRHNRHRGRHNRHRVKARNGGTRSRHRVKRRNGATRCVGKKKQKRAGGRAASKRSAK